MSNADLPARYANGRFGPGNPGRPIGSRNRASNRAARIILRHFEANHSEVLKDLAHGMYEFRPLYVRLLCHLLPKAGELESLDVDDYDEDQAYWALKEAKGAIARIEKGKGTLGELEAALLRHTDGPDVDDDDQGEDAC